MSKSLNKNKETLSKDPWATLSDFTQARIGLGRAGISLPSRAQLKFNIDHALARDAVKTPIDMTQLEQEVGDKGFECLALHSQTQTRQHYLQRPDLGRRLNSKSAKSLAHLATKTTAKYDVALALVDGLSSMAVQMHGANLIDSLSQAIKTEGLSIAPIILVEQGRVAIGDEIGEILGARAIILVIGERPGLSSPDSLGIYYTFAPKIGLKDDRRNCISNIRPAGLGIEAASDKTMWLLKQSFIKKLSGVGLKDLSTQSEAAATLTHQTGNFLLGGS